MYLVSMRELYIILMRIIFYGGLIVVTMLMVMPNGNAHYYYNSLVMGMSVVHRVRSIYLGILTMVIVILMLIF
jgi:hypothetical protein